MKPFTYQRATGARAAVEEFSAGAGEVMYLGGGTNLVDLMRLGVAEPDLLIDVSRLRHRQIDERPNGGLRIGGAVRNSDAAANPLIRRRYSVLSQALLDGASGQLRNMATVGGNLLQRTRCGYFQDTSKPCNKREPGSGCPAIEGEHRNLAILGHSPACVATHPSDMAVALAALDAVVSVEGPGGHRTIPTPGLHRLPDADPTRDTVLQPGELIVAVELPPPLASARSAYRKVRERASFSFAVVSVAAVLELENGRIRECRIALGGVAHAPWRASQAEAVLRGAPATAENFAAAAEAELALARPLRDNGYKVPLLRDVLVRTLADLAVLQPGAGEPGAGPRRVGQARGDARKSGVTAEWVGGDPVGAALDRVEGRDKVTGLAHYAYEYPAKRLAYGVPVQSTIASGEIIGIDDTAALATRGVLAVLSHENGPRLAGGSAELRILQGPVVSYRGQIVAAVVAETLETAREAQRHVRVEYREDEARVELSPEDPSLYRPARLFPNYPTDTEQGDVEAALPVAAKVLDETYTTAATHNNPMEPHASMAEWRDGELVVHDSTQGASTARDTIAEVLGLPAEKVRVISPHVGGGFGSKGTPRPQTILAAIAAQVTDRPVKVAFTRQQMWSLTGYRTPTIQRVRLGADASGRLIAITHDVIEQTSAIEEFAERTAALTRMMYTAANRRTTHRLARLNVPTPSWMRAPGDAPGSFALESAMDELAIRCGIDPVELRIRNEPDIDPEEGVAFSSRNLVTCLREGAERFGWAERDPAPGIRRDGRWLIGTGVAASALPALRSASQATARADPDGSFTVRIAAADIGTGARTVLTQIAAGALGVDVDRVRAEIGDSALPFARLAGGSAGTASWSTAVIRACEKLRDQLAKHDGAVPPSGLHSSADTREEFNGLAALSRYAFGAQFVEVKVDADSREIRVPRMLGAFAAGKIMNAKLARSQIIGGMTWGISMALHEESVLDRQFGDYLNHDLAQYHFPVSADVGTIDVHWIEEDDPHIGPAGAKGIGEIGIVGAAAAIANAVHHATGVRVRDLPIRIDRLIR